MMKSVHSKGDNIEIMINDDIDEVIRDVIKPF